MVGDGVRLGGLAAVLAATALAGSAVAAGLAPGRPAPAPAPATEPAPAAQQSDAIVVLTLVRTSLVALGQADETGNYTVLRDLGTPAFRERNTDADLARIFAPLRAAGIGLAAVVVLDPHLTRATLTPQKQLDVAGSLDSRPAPVTFELLFQPIAGQWRIDGISVQPAAPR